MNKNRQMDIRRMRYFFEHKLLPECFFMEKEKFIHILLQGERMFLYNLMSDICQENQVENIYTPESYNVYLYNVDNGVKLIKICMPEPEYEPLCYRIYLMFDETFEKMRYFTVERGYEDGQIFLCGWDSEGGHLNFGTIPLSEEDELNKCVQLYF